MKNLKNKVVIITGASSGIGKACAEIFGLAGAKIIISARGEENLVKAQKELAAKGISILAQKSDVSSEKDCSALIDFAIKSFGKIDILINNAGISMRAAFNDLDLKVLKQLIDINYWGMVYCTKFALPSIIENKGTVIGISSIAGYKGLPGRTGYASSKFAMNGFLESLRMEMFAKGVNVLTVAPGFTASNIRNTALNAAGNAQSESPLEEKKLMTAEEVAKYILKATLKRKKQLILTGQGKLTVWLNKFFPSFMDKMVYNHMRKEKDAPF